MPWCWFRINAVRTYCATINNDANEQNKTKTKPVFCALLLYYELNSVSFIWNRNWSCVINESVVMSQSA